MAFSSQDLPQIAARSLAIENLEPPFFRLQDFQDPAVTAVLEGLNS
jgi:hypothetical protein